MLYHVMCVCIVCFCLIGHTIDSIYHVVDPGFAKQKVCVCGQQRLFFNVMLQCLMLCYVCLYCCKAPVGVMLVCV
jgi:hypothetical protein